MNTKDIVCPRCFSRHTQEELAWGCANSDCPREAIPTTTSDKNPICSACHNFLTMRFCPDCGFQIVVGPNAAESLPISIVGSESAGKSNYLTVLINELRHSIGRVYDCSLFPLGGDDTILQYEDIYYKPLYEQGRCISSTDQDKIRPLVYSLVFDNNINGKTSTITFYDACGANFRNERVMADYNRSIYNSRGIIFLVDPTQLPVLRDDFIDRGMEVLKDDFSSLLARTIRLIRGGKDQKDLNDKISIPIAICISKLDMIKNKIDPSCFLNYPPRHLKQPAFDQVDFECCNSEVEALIECWSGADLINQVKSQFSNYAFFGFSALGNTPSKDNTVSHVSPYRVGDPFLWLMVQNNVIKSSRFSPAK